MKLSTLLCRPRRMDLSVEITNKMQPCNRIYYSKVYWRLTMFRTAHRSSSGALNCICSLWFIYTCGDRPLLSLSGKTFSHSALTTAGDHMCMQTRGWKYSLELLMMSGVLLETCWAFDKLWNNKFYYKVASCWLFLLIHTAIHWSMNIKAYVSFCCCLTSAIWRNCQSLTRSQTKHIIKGRRHITSTVLFCYLKDLSYNERYCLNRVAAILACFVKMLVSYW